jgi:hypothetical protein
LGKQRKTINKNEGLRPAKYSESRESTSNFDTQHKQVHSTDSDGCGPPKNWKKNLRPPWLESESGMYTPRRDYHPRGGYSNQGRGIG